MMAALLFATADNQPSSPPVSAVKKQAGAIPRRLESPHFPGSNSWRVAAPPVDLFYQVEIRYRQLPSK
jgi:hypothetical protein